MEKIIYQDLELCETEIVSEWKKELKEKYPDCNEEENIVTIYDDIYYKLEQTYKTIKKINLPDTILCIGKIESGNDTEVEYKEYPTLNKCCLFPVEKGLVKSYIDEYGNVRADLHHHDGTNRYLFRMWKRTTPQTQRDNILSKNFNRNLSQTDINRYTERLGDYIGKQFGWSFKDDNVQETSAEETSAQEMEIIIEKLKNASTKEFELTGYETDKLSKEDAITLLDWIIYSIKKCCSKEQAEDIFESAGYDFSDYKIDYEFHKQR